jgi:lipoprotein-anchoring transpeptidase ErfK/SrfK
MVRRRIAPVCALLAGLSAVASTAAVAVAQAPPPTAEPRIAPGVTAGGVDLSNLTVTEATAQLTSVLTPHLSRDLVLGAAGRPFRLKMADAKLRFDAGKTARNALATPAPPPDGAGGVAAKADVPLVLSHSRLAVKAFARQVARKVRRSPRNATLKITLRKMIVRRARVGHALDTGAAIKAVDAALDDGGASRVLHQALRRISPKVNANDLRNRLGGTVVTVDKAHFKLRLFKHLKFARAYGVAVGQPAYPTPSGLFHITNKQVNPTWSVPNSPWAGELQGTTVEGGSAANPLKARWMGIVNGVGIHGTGEDWSIGSRASHGCIRMHVSDVIALYPRVPVGTPVLLK